MATVAKKNHYELMVILKNGLSEKATKEVLENVRGHISNEGGTLTFEDLWGVRTFAYPIEDASEGYYAIFYFDMPKENIANFKKEMDLELMIQRRILICLPVAMNVKEFVEEEKKRAKAEEERVEAEREKKKAEQAKKSPSKAKAPVDEEAAPSTESETTVV